MPGLHPATATYTSVRRTRLDCAYTGALQTAETQQQLPRTMRLLPPLLPRIEQRTVHAEHLPALSQRLDRDHTRFKTQKKNGEREGEGGGHTTGGVCGGPASLAVKIPHGRQHAHHVIAADPGAAAHLSARGTAREWRRMQLRMPHGADP